MAQIQEICSLVSDLSVTRNEFDEFICVANGSRISCWKVIDHVFNHDNNEEVKSPIIDGIPTLSDLLKSSSAWRSCDETNSLLLPEMVTRFCAIESCASLGFWETLSAFLFSGKTELANWVFMTGVREWLNPSEPKCLLEWLASNNNLPAKMKKFTLTVLAGFCKHVNMQMLQLDIVFDSSLGPSIQTSSTRNRGSVSFITVVNLEDIDAVDSGLKLCAPTNTALAFSKGFDWITFEIVLSKTGLQYHAPSFLVTSSSSSSFPSFSYVDSLSYVGRLNMMRICRNHGGLEYFHAPAKMTTANGVIMNKAPSFVVRIEELYDLQNLYDRFYCYLIDYGAVLLEINDPSCWKNLLPTFAQPARKYDFSYQQVTDTKNGIKMINDEMPFPNNPISFHDAVSMSDGEEWRLKFVVSSSKQNLFVTHENAQLMQIFKTDSSYYTFSAGTSFIPVTTSPKLLPHICCMLDAPENGSGQTLQVIPPTKYFDFYKKEQYYNYYSSTSEYLSDERLWIPNCIIPKDVVPTLVSFDRGQFVMMAAASIYWGKNVSTNLTLSSFFPTKQWLHIPKPKILTREILDHLKYFFHFEIDNVKTIDEQVFDMLNLLNNEVN